MNIDHSEMRFGRVCLEKTHPGVTFSTTNLTRCKLGSNPYLTVESRRPTTMTRPYVLKYIVFFVTDIQR
jgi:hypothetical protein